MIQIKHINIERLWDYLGELTVITGAHKRQKNGERDMTTEQGVRATPCEKSLTHSCWF